MQSADIKNRTWTKRELAAIRKGAERQRVGYDSGIDFTDIPKLSKAQLAGMVRLRGFKPKVAVSVRLNQDVLAWLKSKGRGHLTRINDILTNLMEAEQGARPGH